MACDVFISHSAEDKQPAEEICASLEATGIRCWIAPRDVALGDNYAGAIMDAIYSSRATVLLFSHNSNRSQHVLREVERAVSRSVPIIPVRLEDVPASK